MGHDPPAEQAPSAEQAHSDEQTLRDQCTVFLAGHGPVRAADLRAQTGWARDRGAAAHLDGARLWESAAGYGRPSAEIAALFDTVYVSFCRASARWPAAASQGPLTSSPRCGNGAGG